MSAKSDIDRMLDTLESFRAIVPAHVRQLLRMLARRCDELDNLLELVTVRCDQLDNLLASRCGALAGRVTAVEWRLSDAADETEHDAVDEAMRQAAEQEAMDVLYGNRTEGIPKIKDNVYICAKRLYEAGHISDEANG